MGGLPEGGMMPVKPDSNALLVGVVDPVTGYGNGSMTILNTISGRAVVEESMSSISVTQGGVSPSSPSVSHSSSRGAIAAWTMR
jgi:hypothetical protein